MFVSSPSQYYLTNIPHNFLPYLRHNKILVMGGCFFSVLFFSRPNLDNPDFRSRVTYVNTTCRISSTSDFPGFRRPLASHSALSTHGWPSTPNLATKYNCLEIGTCWMSNVSQCMTRQQSNLAFKYKVMCSNVKGRILMFFFGNQHMLSWFFKSGGDVRTKWSSHCKL